MYGHGANNNKLTIHPGENPGFFRGVPALWALPGVMTGAGEQGQGDKKTAYFHALCGNCKENIAKARLKTEISRKTRKFLLKTCTKRKFAVPLQCQKEKPI